MLANVNVGKLFSCCLAQEVTNLTCLKHSDSLKASKSSAGLESDSFNILLAGGEEQIYIFFFPGKLNFK